MTKEQKQPTNVKVTEKQDKFVFEVSKKALNEMSFSDADLSSTGKNYLLGTTHGIIKLSDDVSISINVMVNQTSYDNKIALKEQQELAQKELAEMDKKDKAYKNRKKPSPVTTSTMPAIDPEVLAQAIAIAIQQLQAK